MQSWRDRLGATASAEVDRILDTALAQAQRLLAGASEFEPFALFADAEGRLMLCGYDKAATEGHPEVEQIVDGLLRQLAQVGRTARTTALVLNTRLSRERSDALEVRIEHREGASLLVLLPYKRPKFGGVIEYGELKAFPNGREVWN